MRKYGVHGEHMTRRRELPPSLPPPASGDAVPQFRGYNPIRYTPCPDEFFDRQLADMDDDELRVTLYSFRRTFGFKKTDDAISISQYLHGIVTRDGRRLDAGCGLKTPRQVLAGLAKAERRRTIFSAFFCKSCGGRVPDTSMRDEERTQTLVNGERRTYRVRVVPDHCDHCGRRLRGFEEKRYSLNVLDEFGRCSVPAAVSEGSVPQIEGGQGGSITQTVPPTAPTVPQTVHTYRTDSRATASAIDTRPSVQETAIHETEQHETETRSADRRGRFEAGAASPSTTTRQAHLHTQWRLVADRLRDEMTGRNFTTWVQPVQPLSWTGTELLIGVRDPGIVDYLELRLRSAMERAASDVAGQPVTIRIVVLPA